MSWEQARASSCDELVAWLTDLAARASGELDAETGMLLNVVSNELWGRDDSRVPRALIRALLAHDVERLRVVGAWLAARSDPPVVTEIVALVTGAGEPGMRWAAIGSLPQNARSDPRLMEALLRVMRDSDPAVRLQALHALVRVGCREEATREALLAATLDDDPAVRDLAIESIWRAGPAAVNRALELICDPGLSLEHLDAAAQVVIDAGRAPDVLADDPSVAVTTALLSGLPREQAAGLAGRYRALLPRYQSVDDEDCRDLFDLAAIAGERDLLRDVALSREEDVARRKAAIRAASEHPATVETAVAAAEEILARGEETALMRVFAADQLGEMLSDDAFQAFHGRIRRGLGTVRTVGNRLLDRAVREALEE